MAGGRDAERFDEEIQPILEEHCTACHGNGAKKGGVSLGDVSGDPSKLHDPTLWWAVLRNVRAGMMPPAGKPRPSDDDRRRLENWIKSAAFGIDPNDPDPGRVTVRRLNRVEYRNTIRELLDVDYDTGSEFPADDSGHGFDSIGDVLTMSPLLLEKYITAAKAVVSQAVPTTSRAVTERKIAGQRFTAPGAESGTGTGPRSLSYYEPASVSSSFKAEHAGKYQLVLDLTATERYVDGIFDYNKCRLSFKADGQELLSKELGRQEGRTYRLEFERDWQAGDHSLSIEIQPLTPKENRVRSLAVRVNSVTIRGPYDERYWTKPPSYDRFFPREAPDSVVERRRYALELLGGFATKAFRRPVDEQTLDRLVALAEGEYSRPGQTFESGIAKGMVTVLATPRFLFREEAMEPGSTDRYPLIDEYALASRLSYFLWSSMPDEELFRLAGERKLRAGLAAQVERMLADPRSGEFIRHFIGQWLQARDVDTVLINAPAVLSKDEPADPEADRRRVRFRELNRKPPEDLTDKEKAELKEARANFQRFFRRFRNAELSRELRLAMRRETEMLFEHILRKDRSLLELLENDYTFLNEKLASHYGIEGVKGDEMRLVPLPKGNPRGGLLTQGTVLTVTSNPDRTSPVKRGLYILDNILGTPPPPPPADIPPLEEAAKKLNGRTPTLREALALHRKMPSCASCHNRMDPLGLALENFNALGKWRDRERGQPIDAAGTLVTGESFTGVRELKRILVSRYSRDFYRCLSEKMLTYALGRGLDYHDVETVDRLVEQVEKNDGRPSALLMGVVQSAAFQRRQRPPAGESTNPPGRSTGRASEKPKSGSSHAIKT
jgi:hypothetical protein